jgi:hypothetical protein
MRVAYSYIRFSSEPQAWGDSRRRQTSMAERYANKHGLALDRTLSFRDLGVSDFHSRNRHAGALAPSWTRSSLGSSVPGAIFWLRASTASVATKSCPRKLCSFRSSRPESSW